jgi:hypothetical protein
MCRRWRILHAATAINTSDNKNSEPTTSTDQVSRAQADDAIPSAIPLPAIAKSRIANADHVADLRRYTVGNATACRNSQEIQVNTAAGSHCVASVPKSRSTGCTAIRSSAAPAARRPHALDTNSTTATDISSHADATPMRSRTQAAPVSVLVSPQIANHSDARPRSSSTPSISAKRGSNCGGALPSVTSAGKSSNASQSETSRNGFPSRRRKVYALPQLGLRAMQSISTIAPLGSALTCTHARAGTESPKNSA